MIISAGTLSPSFQPSVTNYNVSLPDGTSSVTITPESASALSSITVNGTTVVSGVASGSITTPVGTNAITVAVTSEDGVTTRTYNVTATRSV